MRRFEAPEPLSAKRKALCLQDKQNKIEESILDQQRAIEDLNEILYRHESDTDQQCALPESMMTRLDEETCENVDDTDSGDEFMQEYNKKNPSPGASFVSHGRRSPNQMHASNQFREQAAISMKPMRVSDQRALRMHRDMDSKRQSELTFG